MTTKILATATTLLACSSSFAGLVTFDPADGYNLGTSLVTGPGWAGNGNLYTITSRGGGNGAALSAAVDQPDFANNRFTPDAAFLGTATTDTAGNRYGFGFDLTSPQAATDDGFGLAHRIRIGGTDGAPIVDFQIFDNGRLQYFSGPGTGVTGNGFSNVVNENGFNLLLDDLDGRYVDVGGTINFVTSMYDLVVDGVVQGSFPLLNTPGQFGQVTFQWGTSTSSPDYRQISVDNLMIEALLDRLAGDANGDGIVSILDFAILRANFGASMNVDFSTGDFNEDGVVSILDFAILRANFGSSLTPSQLATVDAWYASVVPEPTTAALLGLAGLSLLRRRKA